MAAKTTVNQDFVNQELESLKADLAHLQDSVEMLLKQSTENQMKLNTVSTMVEQDHITLMNHQKVLITGNGEPSLMENFRSLNKSLTDFIAEVKAERAKREAKEIEELKEKKEEQKRWRWAVISILLTVVPGFLYQFITFWGTFVPEMNKLMELVK